MHKQDRPLSKCTWTQLKMLYLGSMTRNRGHTCMQRKHRGLRMQSKLPGRVPLIMPETTGSYIYFTHRKRSFSQCSVVLYWGWKTKKKTGMLFNALWHHPEIASSANSSRNRAPSTDAPVVSRYYMIEKRNENSEMKIAVCQLSWVLLVCEWILKSELSSTCTELSWTEKLPGFRFPRVGIIRMMSVAFRW